MCQLEEGLVLRALLALLWDMQRLARAEGAELPFDMECLQHP